MPFKKPHPLYNVWRSMRDRCLNPNFKQWNRYGGRGIKICERWNVFSVFVADMGPRPDGHSLDRINNDGDYEPSNCRWATQKTQMRNQTCTRRVIIDGVSHLAADLAEKAGIKTDCIVERAKRGLPLTEVLAKERRVFVAGLAFGGEANGAKQRSKTHCKYGHPFDEANTRQTITQKGTIGRACKACHVFRQRERNQLKKLGH